MSVEYTLISNEQFLSVTSKNIMCLYNCREDILYMKCQQKRIRYFMRFVYLRTST